MNDHGKRHVWVSLRIVAFGVSLGAVGIMGWLYDSMPDNNGSNLRQHKEQSVVNTPPVPAVSAGQSDLFRAFLEKQENSVSSPLAGQHAQPISPQEIQDKFKEAVNKQQALRANSPFVTRRASEGTGH